MKMIIDNRVHDFMNIKEPKIEVKLQKLDVSKDKEVKLFK